VEDVPNSQPIELEFTFNLKKDKSTLCICSKTIVCLEKTIRTKNILGRNSFVNEDSSLFYPDIFARYATLIDDELGLLSR
jgi:hypothetical protein